MGIFGFFGMASHTKMGKTIHYQPETDNFHVIKGTIVVTQLLPFIKLILTLLNISVPNCSEKSRETLCL